MRTITEADIYKEAVIGFVVIKGNTTRAGVSAIDAEPICGWDDGIGNPVYINKNQSIVGILPAPAGSYRIYGFGNDGMEVELGYEYPGAYHPDWIEELKTQRKAV